MNFLNQYFTTNDAGQVCIKASQASDFAKTIANDFNPIHDEDSKRFCVPGDLLFAVALQKYGLHKNMVFQFLDLIKADTPLAYPADSNTDSMQLNVLNDKGKPVLCVDVSGGRSMNALQIEQLIKNYVAFSGHNFPHVLVPLMKQHNVMINPQRPLVIYQSMSLEFSTLQFESLDIELEKTALDVNGKRGNAQLHFSLSSEGQTVGAGVKNLVLSGLREYDQQSIDQMCETYLASKTA